MHSNPSNQIHKREADQSKDVCSREEAASGPGRSVLNTKGLIQQGNAGVAERLAVHMQYISHGSIMHVMSTYMTCTVCILNTAVMMKESKLTSFQQRQLQEKMQGE